MAAKGATAALLLLLLAALLVSAPPTAAAAAAAEQKGGEMNSPHTVSTACSSWSVVRPLRLRVRDPRRGSVRFACCLGGGGRAIRREGKLLARAIALFEGRCEDAGAGFPPADYWIRLDGG
jgi:hypothetical protein